ncbi:MAG TPA: hypothetical protein VIU41_03685 [Geobacteraceae bacterium]
MTQPASLAGITFYQPPLTAVLTGRDGRVQLPYGDLPIPLQEEDFAALAGAEPSYDAVGRGLAAALRMDPDLPHGARYALMLQQGYPHLFAELASELVMLDRKDVEAPYLDRKINYLKVFALLEPTNHRLPLQIGATFLEKGLRLSILHQATFNLYRAERYLKEALEMMPTDVQARHLLGEVSFLLGKYDKVRELWGSLQTELAVADQELVARRLARIESNDLPLVPAVDYLQAIGMAMEAFDIGDYEESAAILQDVMADAAFYSEFPLAEISYLLGLSYVRQGITGYGAQFLRQALALRPDYPEAQETLATLAG